MKEINFRRLFQSLLYAHIIWKLSPQGLVCCYDYINPLERGNIIASCRSMIYPISKRSFPEVSLTTYVRYIRNVDYHGRTFRFGLANK